jgi:magnesium-transporting ATPase (P-type)
MPPSAVHDSTPPVWHALSPEQVAEYWAVDALKGLVSTQVVAHQKQFGPNELPEVPPVPVWRRFVQQFKSPLIAVLFVAALLSVMLRHAHDAAVILVVVFINALIGQFQEGRAERSMASLKRMQGGRARVVRAGLEQDLPAREVVPGDLLILAAGDAVAADARIIEHASLHCAEAVLTGESVPVEKDICAVPAASSLADRHDMVYSGTLVTHGRARALVVAIGIHTEIGRVAQLTQQAVEPMTPLQVRMHRLGRVVIGTSLFFSVLLVVLGLGRDWPLDQLVMVAISQMVSMVPEGLPVAMTIALAVGMQRMARRGAVVRRLAAVETLGSSTVICTDKTGTLTCNEMTVAAVWLPDGRRLEVDGVGYAPVGVLRDQGREIINLDEALRSLLMTAVLCNDASLVPPEQADGTWQILGDPTEGALVVLARKAGLNVAQVRQDAPRYREWPFDSEIKLMATAHDNPRRILVKGAPEAVLSHCGAASSALLQDASHTADSMANEALRVLAFAVIEDASWDPDAGWQACAGRARLLGLVGQRDPPREGVRQAVAQCWAAGIRPIMITGDHQRTGLAVARELGIARAQDRALDGPELERMGEGELRDQLDQIAVFARVQPAQKLRIVEALQARGDVVAMTGDGVNDAPALARADVGVAMGRGGTEVAKNAAKVVLADDNFATILAAVEQGRVVYGNVQKLIVYLMSASLAEVLIVFLALIGGLPLPLAAVQILWINLVTEGTVTINLVMEPADGDVMQRAPLPRKSSFLTRDVVARIVFFTVLIATLTLAWFAWRLNQGVPELQARTEAFTLLAMCQWFNVLNCRSARTSLFRWRKEGNGWLLGGLVVSIGLHGLVLYAPIMNGLFQTVPIAGSTLVLLVATASVMVWVEELRKAWCRRPRVMIS